MANKGKARRASKFRASGKFVKQFARTVKRTGKWRGKKIK